MQHPWTAHLSVKADQPQWQRQNLTVTVTVQQVTNRSSTEQTMSWNCRRRQPAGKEPQLVAGPYLVLSGAWPKANDWLVSGATGWHARSNNPRTALPPEGALLVPLACGWRDGDNLGGSLGSTWSPLKAPADATVAEQAMKGRRLVFVVPQDGMTEGRLGDYNRKIFGLVWMTDQGKTVTGGAA